MYCSRVTCAAGMRFVLSLNCANALSVSQALFNCGVTLEFRSFQIQALLLIITEDVDIVEHPFRMFFLMKKQLQSETGKVNAICVGYTIYAAIAYLFNDIHYDYTSINCVSKTMRTAIS